MIVWNAQTQTEHFIRHATFETNAADFGFLVPTPTPPTLAEASPIAFARLEAVIQPRVETRTRHTFRLTLLLGSCAHTQSLTTGSAVSDKAFTPPVVSVLSTQRVGRYEATVLAASDAGALARWLTRHGYATRPAMQDWLKPYVAAHWTLTAFKIAKDSDAKDIPNLSEVGSSVVRMSFHTAEPFFPYREPADQRIPGISYPPRLLRVFLLADARLNGNLGRSGAAWPAQTVWSNVLAESQVPDLNAELSLPAGALPPRLRLTALEDHSSPRPGTDDVYFKPTADQSALLPPPIIDIHDIPIDVPLDLLLVVAFLLLRLVVKVRQART